MQRQSHPPAGIADSDEILSDDDAMDDVISGDCAENVASRCWNGEEEKKKKVHLPVLSQLESLTEKEQNLTFGAREVNLRQRCPSSALGAWKLENLPNNYTNELHEIQDESHRSVRPLSSNEHHSESCDDSISDEENAVLSKLSVTGSSSRLQMNNSRILEGDYQHEVCTWSAVTGDVQELATVHNNTDNGQHISEISEARKNHGGDKGRGKHKFSFRALQLQRNLSRSGAMKEGNTESSKGTAEDSTLHDKHEHVAMHKSLAELFGNIREESDEQPMKVVSYHEQKCEVSSMAELLEGLQHKNTPLMGPPNLFLQNVRVKERKTKFSGKRVLHQLGSRILDSDYPEIIEGGFSSEDEDNDQHHICVSQNDKQHTMADLFQEAFSRSEADNPFSPTNKQSGIGYHGRLQQVLQIEKDRHMGFLKQLQMEGCSSNYSECMDVQIMSRILEARLTVCQCLSGAYANGPQFVKGTLKHADNLATRTMTIIFTSKVCDKVELEVGNFIRIHPPWKEVLVNEDQKILLCTYFSQVMPGEAI